MNPLDIEKIEAILGTAYSKLNNTFSWMIDKIDTKDKLLLTIYNDVKIDGTSDAISLISAQNNQGYFELHNCNKYFLFEPDEIIFLNISENSISSLVVSASGNLSVFSNINRKILQKDITTLDSSLLMSAMQLSITEEAID